MKEKEKNTLNEEREITLVPREELLVRAKEIAEATLESEKFLFTLHYDTENAGFVKKALNELGVTPEEETEDSVTAHMNMEQLEFMKSIDCIEKVTAEERDKNRKLRDFRNKKPSKKKAKKKAKKKTAPVAEAPAATADTPAVMSATADTPAGMSGTVETQAVAASSDCCCCPTNTTMEKAQEIKTESLIDGCICCPGTTQWFKFTAPESRKYTISTVGSLDTVGTLYNASGEELNHNDDFAGKTNFRIIRNLVKGSTYYITVRANNSETGNYMLKVTNQAIAESVELTSKYGSGVIILTQGKTYELPRGVDYDPVNPDLEMAPVEVKISPDNTTDKRIYWYENTSSSVIETNFAWFHNSTKYQTLTAKSVGGACLYASDWLERGKRDKIYVAVVPENETLKKVTSIDIFPTYVEMNKGSYHYLTTSVNPIDATVSDVTWKSTLPNIATVTSYGRIKALNYGKVEIVAESMDGEPTVRASCEVHIDPIRVNKVGGIEVMSSAIGGNVLGIFDNGAEVLLVDETPHNETMFKVSGITSSGEQVEGWCSGKYLTKEVEYAYLKSTDNWIVRKEATTDSERLGLIYSGSFVRLLVKSHSINSNYVWHKILYNNNIGYVADNYSGGDSVNYIFVKHIETLVNAQPPFVPTIATKKCKEYIINYEGFFATPKDDGYGHKTIGYGHLIKEGEQFTTITSEEAMNLFSQDIDQAQLYVSNLAKNRSVIYNQQQFDAFVSLCYNSGADTTGSVMDEINSDVDPYDAFSKISHSNGTFSIGLYRRRMDDADIYVLGDYARDYRPAPMGN